MGCTLTAAPTDVETALCRTSWVGQVLKFGNESYILPSNADPLIKGVVRLGGRPSLWLRRHPQPRRSFIFFNIFTFNSIASKKSEYEHLFVKHERPYPFKYWCSTAIDLDEPTPVITSSALPSISLLRFLYELLGNLGLRVGREVRHSHP